MTIVGEHGPELAVERAGLFDSSKHPRGRGAQGGQFVAKGNSGNNDTIGYDARHGTGAGYGAKGGKGDERVKSLQRVLNNLGLTDSAGKPLLVDGKLGPRTTAAIKRLQRRMGLPANGLVTPALLKKIQAVDAKRHADFKAGKKGTREAALASLSSKRHTVARPAKKAAAPARMPAKRKAR